MTQYAYLGVLVLSMTGMVTLDRWFKLALFYDRRRTAQTIGISVAVFILWDILGISLGIFYSGRSAYMSGLYLGPEFPLEELFFLVFLCYFTLVVYRIGERVWPRT